MSIRWHVWKLTRTAVWRHCKTGNDVSRRAKNSIYMIRPADSIYSSRRSVCTYFELKRTRDAKVMAILRFSRHFDLAQYCLEARPFIVEPSLAQILIPHQL